MKVNTVFWLVDDCCRSAVEVLLHRHGSDSDLCCWRPLHWRLSEVRPEYSNNVTTGPLNNFLTLTDSMMSLDSWDSLERDTASPTSQTSPTPATSRFSSRPTMMLNRGKVRIHCKYEVKMKIIFLRFWLSSCGRSIADDHYNHHHHNSGSHRLCHYWWSRCY